MRQIADGLNDALYLRVLHFVEGQRKDNGNRK